MNEDLNAKKVFTQKLTGRQRLFLRSPASSVTMVARIQGNISYEGLKQAINHMQQRHMMLQVRVIADENEDPWFTSDEVGAISIKQINRASADHWQQIYVNELQIPFEIDKRPLIRFILLYSPDVSDLLIFCQHSICDGLSLAYLTHDLLDYLNNQSRTVESLPPPPVLEESIPSKFLHSRKIKFLGKLLFSRYNKKWTRAGITFDSEDSKNLFSAYWDHYKLQMSSCAVEGEKLSQLISSCREKSITVNTILITAFHAALFDNKRDENTRFFPNVNIAMDLRKDLSRSAKGSFGLFATGTDCKLQYDPKKSFWENATHFHRRIQKEIELTKNYRKLALLNNLEPKIMEALPFICYSKHVKPEATRFDKLSHFNEIATGLTPKFFQNLTRLSTGLIITNLGRFPFPEEYGELHLKDLFFVPTSSIFIEIVLGVVTISDKLNISICYLENVIDPSAVEKIKHQAMEYLNTAITA